MMDAVTHDSRSTPQDAALALDPVGASADEPAGRGDVGQVMRFALVGVGSTVLYTVLFAGLDMVMNHYVANVVALLICTVLNTWVNQRFTFDAAGHEGGRAAHVQSLAILGVTLAVTSGALAFEHHQWPGASTVWDTVTVTVGNAIATVIRFVVFRKIFTRNDV